MDKFIEHVRLNHFVLWCKGWYRPVDKNENIFESALRSLKLDGYDFAHSKDVIGIALNYIDDLIDSNMIDHRQGELRMINWHNNILENMRIFKVDYNTALLYVIENFFAFSHTRHDLNLTPPVYSRKLFKMGFIAPKHFGGTYKQQNNYAYSYFANRKSLK